ncbi:hypothetical protein N7492_008125 [Penicillium capsulatum]|uniref:Phosphatidylethanolamine-binding protein n=1 Tax=Penicillium capsulatum TaxID=69766 RepID=A0A9W9LGS3_9EURO|nr:hypothetical protein N7492_008125 [Penicillium capsulatum]KAJ6105536.1 hypothetical protein N7512_009053 [Penicillium capsulatum]
MNYIEYGFSRLFANAKGRDAKLFTKSAAFAQHTQSSILLECRDIGPSGSSLPVDLSADGAGHFPSLRWPAAAPETKEYLLVSEDPDAPLPNPIIHGLYYGIPPTATGVGADDFLETAEPHTLKGGFRYGKNRKGTVYIPPRPLVGHGPHRYFFTLVALTEPLDTSGFSALPTIEEVATAIKGKVFAWGEWVGSYERKWQ